MGILLSEFPPELLEVISKRLKFFEDFFRFRCVSKSLYASVKDEYFEGLRLRQRLPYFLLPVKDDHDDDVRELYSLVEGESIVASVRVPNFKAKKCFESLGWLLTVAGDGNMALVEPFSGSEIPLPHQNTVPEYAAYRMERHPYVFIQKMVLSARPDETSDFILMVICGSRFADLAFWRLGDKAWTKITRQRSRFYDVLYLGHRKFYALGYPGSVWLIKFGKNDNSVRDGCLLHVRPPVLPYYELSYDQLPYYPSRKLYLLKALDGSLHIITRTNDRMNEDLSSCLTTRFQVYAVDVKKKTLEEIYNLGNMAVFVGHNSTIALDAVGFPGGVIKANHIYFTDDDWEYYYFYLESPKGGGLNIGVYNMETGTIEPFYHGELATSKVSTSLWINPLMFQGKKKTKTRKRENDVSEEVTDAAEALRSKKNKGEKQYSKIVEDFDQKRLADWKLNLLV